jgi:hypothetical protein
MPKVLLNPYRNELSIDGLVLKHDSWLDQPLLTTSDVTLNSLVVKNLTADGTIILKGTVTEVETTRLLVKDAFIELNQEENSLAQGGVIINRGNSLQSYKIIYNESDTTLRVGSSVLIPVATRQENPIDSYLGVWNAAQNCFITTNVISAQIQFNNIRVNTLFLGSDSSPSLSTDSMDNLYLNTIGNVILGSQVPNTKIIVPIGRILHFASNTTSVDLSELNGQLYIANSVQLNNTVGINWGGQATIITTSTGNNLQLSSLQTTLECQTLYLKTSTLYHGIGNIATFSIDINQNYIISTVGNMYLEAGIGYGVYVSQLGIGLPGPYQVDLVASSNGNFSINAPGMIILNPSTYTITTKPICFGTSSLKIRENLGDLEFKSSAGITLSAVSQVYIPASVPLNLATNTSIYEDNIGRTVLSNLNNDIILYPGNSHGIKIGTNVPIKFGTNESIYSNGSAFVVSSQDTILLNAMLNVTIPIGVPLQLGDSLHLVYQDISGDTNITSNHNLNLSASSIKTNCPVYIGTGEIFQDIDGSLTFTSLDGVKSLQDVSITSTTAATVGGGSLNTSGGIYAGGNIIANNGLLVKQALVIGTSVTSAVTIQDSSIPIRVTNSSINSGLVMEMTATWDPNNGYTIGRGSQGGRSMYFTIPSYNIYGTGTRPSFVFSSNTGTNCMNISDTITTVSGFFQGNNGAAFTGIVQADSFQDTLGTFIVNSTSVTVNSGLNVTNFVNVTDTNSNPIFSVNSAGMISNNSASFLHNVEIVGVVTSTGTMYSNGGIVSGGNVNIGGNRLYNVASPLVNSDVATKLYVDSVAIGRTDKMAVKAGSTSNVDLATSIFTMDGITLTIDDRVLLKDQSLLVENGIYIISMSNLLSRAADMATGSDASGSAVFVQGGIVNGTIGYVIIGTSVIVGTSNLAWTPFSGSSTLNASYGLTKIGNTLQVNVDNFSTKINNNNQVVIDTNFFGTTFTGGNSSVHLDVSNQLPSLNTVGTITQGTWNGGVIEVAYGGTGLNNVPNGNIMYGNGTGTLGNINLFNFEEINMRLGVGTNNPNSSIHARNKIGSFSGTTLLLEDVDSLINQSSGLKIQNIMYQASLSLTSSGSVTLSNDTLNASSKLTLATLQVDRLIIDSNGNVTIGSNLPYSGALLSVYGNLVTQNITSLNSINLPNATIQNDSLNNGGVLVTTGSFRITSNFYTPKNATIGNVSISSTGTISTILSSVTLQIRVSQFQPGLCAIGYNGGFIVPNIFQIGGNELDPTTGFQMQLISNNLQISPGLTGEKVIFQTETVHDKLTLHDSTFPSTSSFVLLDNTMSLTSNSVNGINFVVGGASSSDIIVTFENLLGDMVQYDPTNTGYSSGGVWNISKNVTSILQGDVYNQGFTRYTIANAAQGVFSNIGWYYLGQLSSGTTTIKVDGVWQTSIVYNGTDPYTTRSSIIDRTRVNLVIYKNNLLYKIFIQLLVQPIHINIIESASVLSTTQYEGAGSVPSGVYSNFINTWTLDFNTSVIQANSILEIGTLTTNSSSNLTNILASGTSTITGTLNVTASTTFKNTQFDWTTSNTVPVMRLTTDTASNNLSIYGTDTQKTILNFIQSDAVASVKLNDSSSNYANALEISHDTNSTLSKIILSTRSIPRIIIDDVGNVNITGALVAGSTLVSMLNANQITTPMLNLINGNSSGTLTVDTAGNIVASNSRITNVADPVNANDVATKQYVESRVQGLQTKQAVYAASTVDIDTTVAISAIDNILLQPGSRILLKDQTNKVDNGIYTVQSSLPPIRSSDMSLHSSANGVYVYVEAGNVNGTSGWVCTNAPLIDIVGTNNLVFAQFSGAGQITAGNGLQKIGNILQIKLGDSSLETNLGILRVSSGIAGIGLSGGSGVPLSISSITHLSTLGTITTGIWNGSTIDVSNGGTGSTGYSSGSVIFSNGVTLTQGQLYFDAINKRLGINTNYPTSGLTLQDRDIQLTQTLSTPNYMLFSSSLDNYTYALRNDTRNFVLSAGNGSDKNTLQDIASFNTNGTLHVNAGIVTSNVTIGNTLYNDTSVTRQTNGPLNVSYFSSNNAGTSISFYGGLGSPSDVSNSEYMQIGHVQGNYIIGTGSTGSGQTRGMIFYTGGNTNQLNLLPTGDLYTSGGLLIDSTISSTSTTSGALIVSGGIGTQGSVYMNKLNASSSAFIGGSLQLGAVLKLSTCQVSSSLTSSLAINSTTPGTAAYLHLTCSDSSNTNDTKMRIFGLGKDVTLNTEWLEIGYDVSSIKYLIQSTRSGSGASRPLVVSSLQTVPQIELSPMGTVTVNATLIASNFSCLSTVDAVSSINGGAMTINGGLGVSKSLFVGNYLESTVIKATSRIEYSNQSSIDNVFTNYYSSGTFNYYNNSLLTLNIHIGNSDGPSGSNQEKLVFGYKNSTTLSILSTSTGSGQLRDLTIETRLLSSLDGSVSFSSKVYIGSNLQVTNNAIIGTNLQVDGTVNIGNGTYGTLIQLKGHQNVWNIASSVLGQLVLQPTSSTTGVLSIQDASNTSILNIDTINKTLTSNTSVSIVQSSTQALVLSNGNTSMFIFDTINQQFDVAGGKITNLALPQNASDAVNKSYVDSIALGLNFKQAVLAGTTVNINILNPVTILDGITLQSGYRVIIKNQINQYENGIYIVNGSNFITRSLDFANGSHVAGSFVYVEQGTYNGNKSFVCISPLQQDIVGTNNIQWTLFSSGASGGGGGSGVNAGNGLTFNGIFLDVYLDSFSGLSFNSSKLRIDPGIAGNGLIYGAGVLSLASITSVSTLVSGTWNASTIQVQYGGTGSSSFADQSLVYSNSTQLIGTSGLVWNYNKSALGLNSTADPNSIGDGLTIRDKDLVLKSSAVDATGYQSSLLFSDLNNNYNWRIRKLIASSSASVLPVALYLQVVMSYNGNIGITTSYPGQDTYITTNYASTWQSVDSLNTIGHAWGEACISQDGTYILIASEQDYLYVSQNSGATFSQRVLDFTRFWEWTSISRTGQYMMASSLADGVFTSNDYGSTWTIVSNIPTDTADVGFVLVTKTGNYQFAGYFPGQLYMSTNNGVSFTAVSLRSGNWYDIAEASNSNYLVLYEYTGSLFISNNLGASWTEVLSDVARPWIYVAISANGSVIAAIEDNGLLYVSINSGNSFTVAIDTTPRPWKTVKVSADGSTIYAAGNNIPVYMSNNSGVTWSTLSSNMVVYSSALSPITNVFVYPEYNGRIHSYNSTPTSDLIFSAGQSTTKSSLSDTLVLTASGKIGIGYSESTVQQISATLDVIGNMSVSQSLVLGTALDVSNGGTGAKNLAYGLLLAGNQFTSTGLLSSGQMPIGNSNGSGTVVLESGNTLRTHLGLGIGVNVQAHSSTLDSLATLTPTNASFIVGNGSIFTVQSASNVSTLLGLGTLATRNTVNNSYFMGTQLSVSNGGTGSTTFTTSSIPYYTGSVMASSLLSFDTVNQGIGINTSSVVPSSGLTVYGSNVAVQASINTTPSRFLFVNSNGNFAWSIRRQEDGITLGNSDLIFSGGTSSSTLTALSDTMSITSSGTILIYSTTDTTSLSTGALIVNGGVSIGASLQVSSTATFTSVVMNGLSIHNSVDIGGVVDILSTIDSSSSSTGSLIVSGGIGLVGSMFSQGQLVVQRDSITGSQAYGVTISADTTSWVSNTSILNTSRHLSLVNNSINGAVVLSMKNLHSNYGWDQIVQGNENNLLVWQTTGTQNVTWATLDATNGSFTLYGTASSALVVNGGINVQKNITANGSLSVQNIITVSNTTSVSQIKLSSDIGTGAIIKLNTSTTSADGGLNGMTIRNNNGTLRLQSSLGQGITISSGNTTVDSTQNSTSSSTGALVVNGGLGVASDSNFQGNVTVNGILKVDSMTSIPSVSTPAGDLINISLVSVTSAKLVTINDVNMLQVVLQVTPTSSSTNTQFSITLPNKSTNFASIVDLYSSNVSIFEDVINLNIVQGLLVGIVSSTKALVKFTSHSTGVHYVQVYVSY